MNTGWKSKWKPSVKETQRALRECRNICNQIKIANDHGTALFAVYIWQSRQGVVEMLVWMANTQNSNPNPQTSVVLFGRQELNFRDAAWGTLGQHKMERKWGHKSYVMVHLCFHTGQRNGNDTTLSTPSVCTVISPFSTHTIDILIEAFITVWVLTDIALSWTDSLTPNKSRALVVFQCGITNFDFFLLSAACFHKIELSSK